MSQSGMREALHCSLQSAGLGHVVGRQRQRNYSVAHLLPIACPFRLPTAAPASSNPASTHLRHFAPQCCSRAQHVQQQSYFQRLLRQLRCPLHQGLHQGTSGARSEQGKALHVHPGHH